MCLLPQVQIHLRNYLRAALCTALCCIDAEEHYVIPGLLWKGLVAYLGVIAIWLYLHNGISAGVFAEVNVPALQLAQLGQF